SAYPVESGSARQVRPGGYTFHSLGVDTPLFNLPETEADVTGEPGERNVPDVLDAARLEAEAQALATDRGAPVYFGSTPVLGVRIDGEPVPPEALCFRDLEEWAPPPRARRAGGREISIRAAVDPARGRITLPAGAEPASVEVAYAYGSAGDVGGGPYDRRATLTPSSPGVPEWTVGAPVPGTDPARHFATLDGALDAWEQQGGKGVVRLVDDRTHSLAAESGFRRLRLGDGHLVIEAVDGVHPTVAGSLEVVGGGSHAHLHLGGVRLDGTVRLVGEVSLLLSHCTLRPGSEPAAAWRSSVEAWDAGPGMRVVVERCITGPLSLPARIAGLAVRDSIVDGGFGYAVADGTAPHDDARPGPPSAFLRTSVFGMVRVSGISLASETVFQGLVLASRDQEGTVEFCYVPPESQTPPRHRCQPDLVLAADGDAARVRPRFTSTRYGDPGYAQLAPDCPREIRTGARDGSEMGVFHHLQQPQREANLREVLEEYLPYGVRAGIFYVT
ncbi:MAG TPA: hypothetical protein VHG28_00425, partial [Longimicrobiaceae bacterium]|nr:hypothetical protein [Longimicrobiaceae bacterium]